MKRLWTRNWVKAVCLLLLVAGSMLIGGLALAGFGSDKAVAQLGAATSGAVATASTVSPSELQDRVAQMMKDHMGLTAQQASDWASTMVEHMQAVHGDVTGSMIDQMNRFYVNGTMMNGQYGSGGMMNSGYGAGTIGPKMGIGPWSGQRGPATSSTTTVTNPVRGSMMGNAGPRPGTMMNSGMTEGMHRWATTTTTTAGGSHSSLSTTSTTQVTTQPTQSTPSSGALPTRGSVMGTMMGGTGASGAGQGPAGSGMMGTGGMGFSR